MIFNLEVWYRYNGGDDKDFFHTEIEADNFEQAKTIAKTLRMFVFKVLEI